MPVPIAQPHTAQVSRPNVKRDADSNAATETAAGVTPRSVGCMFQRRSGSLSVNPVGDEYTFDAIIYITDVDADVQTKDRIAIDIPGTNERFNVADVEPKYGTRGKFSHYEIPLSRNIVGT